MGDVSSRDPSSDSISVLQTRNVTQSISPEMLPVPLSYSSLFGAIDLRFKPASAVLSYTVTYNVSSALQSDLWTEQTKAAQITESLHSVL